MKKKIICGLSVFTICFVLVGCDQPKVKEEKDLTFTEWAQKNNKIYNDIKKINCPEIEESSLMSGSSEIFVTDNNIYKYNVDKLFSNDKNCKLIGTVENAKTIAVSKDNAIDEMDTLYNDFWQKVEDSNFDGNYQKDDKHNGWKEYIKRFNVNKQLISASGNYSIGKDIPDYEIITYTNDGLYLYKIDYINSNNSKGTEYKYKVDIDSLKDEEIVRLYGTIIKTNKAFYKISSDIINKEECNKYADIKCEYEYSLKKDETLTKYYDDILNITNSYFITKNYDLVDITGFYH